MNKDFFKGLGLALLMAMPMAGCSNKTTTQLDNGAVIISGDLTYDKVMDALAPLMSKEKGSGTKAVATGRNLTIDEQLRVIDCEAVTSVVFTQGTPAKATIDIPDEWKDRIEASYADGVLRVRVTGRHQFGTHNGTQRIRLNVQAPQVEKVDLSGVSSFQTTSLLAPKGLAVDISGASNVAIGSLTGGGRLSVETSGASNVAVGSSECSEVVVDLSGASKVGLTKCQAKRVSLDVSGASSLSFGGTTSTLSADVSGASRVTLEGKASKVAIDLSGMSKADISKLTYDSLQKETSGLSRIEK